MAVRIVSIPGIPNLLIWRFSDSLIDGLLCLGFSRTQDKPRSYW